MKTKKESRKELAAKILDKIQEAFSGVDNKAVKKIKRSAEGTAKKLAKKISATVDRITKKEEAAAIKAKKKEAKKAKKVNKTLPTGGEKTTKKKEVTSTVPVSAPVVAPQIPKPIAVPKVSSPETKIKAAPKKPTTAPVQVTDTISNGVHKDENKEAL